ncbi:hypothetical protein Zmor_027202 [Zophobas morio]|uniref:Uncharacterized protein n=1 Tax=Zophobas morio TaxID=2755281 RepID=A0AA38HNN5_9CUCU|nr:hypothetical protein Zmor_027202 [Zophobas morio]
MIDFRFVRLIKFNVGLNLHVRRQLVLRDATQSAAANPLSSLRRSVVLPSRRRKTRAHLEHLHPDAHKTTSSRYELCIRLGDAQIRPVTSAEVQNGSLTGPPVHRCPLSAP